MADQAARTALETRLEASLASRRQRQILRTLSSDPASPTSGLVDFSSNDYLSLSRSSILKHNLVNELASSSCTPYGPPSSRLLDGNSRDHIQLEHQLATFLRGDAALLFNSGFDANVGLWSCLPAKDDYIVYDELIHASTHDGMRLSRVPKENRRPFKHNSVESLKSLLGELSEDVGVKVGTKSVWVAVETLYSMDGDLAPLQEIVEAVEEGLERGNGHMVVDEAHSTGLYGSHGRGVVCALGLETRITIRVHTFGKAIACSGGVVLCNPLIRSYLINYARPLIYSTVMPTMNVLAISKSFEMLERGYGEEPARNVHLLSNLLYSSLSTFLTTSSSPISLPPILPPSPSLLSPMPHTTPILPLLTHSPRVLSAFLGTRGYLVRPISYPTVPKGQERIRVCLHAGNTEEDVMGLVSAIHEWYNTESRKDVVTTTIRFISFAAYNVRFSPFFPNKLAVAGSANFGLVGNGRLSLLGTGPAGMGVEKVFDTQDGLYDVAWSEVHENQLATCSGDGSVKLWDTQLNDFPIRKWHEHAREVFSINWNNVQKNLFCTGSWDCTIKLWTPDRPTSILTIPAHTACVYSAIFSPSQPTTIASCSSDGTLKIWDTRSPTSSTPSSQTGPGQPSTATPSLNIQAHPAEVLSLDWNKYQPHLIATGSVDRSIRIHDLRMASSTPPSSAATPIHLQPSPTVATLLGHEYAVRSVAWSPHSANVLASASYDMTARLWGIDSANLGAGGGKMASFGAGGMGGGRVERLHAEHTEFVVGLSWSYFDDTLASCSWDQEVHLWR